MAESPTFSGFSNDAADTFAKVIAQIKSDMASIEASAKNIESSLTKASRQKVGGGSSFGAQNSGGGTGFSKDAGGTSALGKISSQVGGAKGIGYTAAFGAGAAMGGLGGGGAIAGGLAFAGLPDLVMRPERALDMEAARFGVAQSTGDFGSFRRMMDGARNDFNVQNEQAFQNSVVYGTQRAGMVGLNGGGTVGERRAASQIGGYNTMAGLAGIDQSRVPGAMAAMQSSQAYYASMAAGVQTRNPVTGELLGVESQINQLWSSTGIRKGTSTEEALKQIDIQFGAGGMGDRQLTEMYGGDEAAKAMVVEGLRIRARTGKPLTENQVQEQMKALGAEGGLGTEKTQGMEGVRGLESAKVGMGMEYLDDATAGIEEATKHITNAVDLLTELEGPLRDLVGHYTTLANQMDVFKTELPRATEGITSFLTGLPGLLMSFLLGKGMGGGGLSKLLGGGLARTAGKMLLKQGLMAGGRALVGNPVGATVVAVAGAGYLAHKYGKSGDEMPQESYVAMGSGPGAQQATTGSGGYGGAQSSNSSGYGRAKGDWFVEADQDDRIHYGEMVIPSRIAEGVRKELALGKTGGSRATSNSGGSGATVNIYLTIQKASDQEAMQFATKVKRLIENDRELMSIGSGRLSSG